MIVSLETTIEGLEVNITSLQTVIAESSEGSNSAMDRLVEANQTISMHQAEVINLHATISGLEGDITSLQTVIAESTESSSAASDEANQTIATQLITIEEQNIAFSSLNEQLVAAKASVETLEGTYV
jgi:chromosome segregation ATPase